MKLNKYLTSALVMLALVSCGKSKDNKDNGSQPSSETETPDDTTSVGLLTVDDTAVANVGALAIGSIGPASFGFEGDTSLRLSGDASDRDANCSDNGSPVKDDVELDVNEDEFAARKLYCASVFDTANPDSAQGAMTLANMFMCEMKRAGAWSDDHFTATANAIGTVEVAPSLNCLKQYQLDNIAPSGETYELTNVTFLKAARYSCF